MIGRSNEADILRESTEKSQAQLVVVYGRRRVGKTFLVRETFPDGFFFQHTGILDVPMAGQLAAFRDSLIEAGAKDVPELADWREAFNELKRRSDCLRLCGVMACEEGVPQSWRAVQQGFGADTHSPVYAPRVSRVLPR